MLPEWTTQYTMAKSLSEDDEICLVLMPLTLGRARVAVANWCGPLEFW